VVERGRGVVGSPYAWDHEEDEGGGEDDEGHVAGLVVVVVLVPLSMI